MRATAEKFITDPLKMVLNDLRGYLKAEPVDRRDAAAGTGARMDRADGRARVEVTPKGDTNWSYFPLPACGERVPNERSEVRRVRGFRMFARQPLTRLAAIARRRRA